MAKVCLFVASKFLPPDTRRSSIVADITAKVGHINGIMYDLTESHQVIRNDTGDLIADLTITNLTVTLRAVAAIKFGLTLQNAYVLSDFTHTKTSLGS